MEELIELQRAIEEERYSDALTLARELEEMSLDDKINKIYSYAIILLLHLIKKAAQSWTTRSWEFSIRNSVREINRTNKRRKAGGFYIKEEELMEVLEEAYIPALEKAAIEAFEGQLTETQLEMKFDKKSVIQEAFQLILGGN